MGSLNGFSLMEMLIYTALSILLVVLVLQFVSMFQRLVVARSGAALYLTSLYAGVDSMVRDCALAPADPRLWTYEQQNKIMWQSDYGVQGFAFDKATLMRISRSRGSDGQLKAPVYTPLVHDVQGSFVICRSRDFVATIGIVLTAHYRDNVYSMNKYVHLREGVAS